MKSLEQKIIVRCKNCGWRIFDKVTMTTGVIELKCPNCHRVVEVQNECEVEEEKPAENRTDENAALLAKLLSNPETAALLKALAKTI